MPRKIMKSDKYVDDVAPSRPKKANITKAQLTRRARFQNNINPFALSYRPKSMQTWDTGTMKKPALQYPKPTYKNPWEYIEPGNTELPKPKEYWVPDKQGNRRPPPSDPGFSRNQPKNTPSWQEPFNPNNPYHTWKKFHPNSLVQPIFRDWDKKNPKKGGFQL
jgi:hypothetical protein